MFVGFMCSVLNNSESTARPSSEPPFVSEHTRDALDSRVYHLAGVPGIWESESD